MLNSVHGLSVAKTLSKVLYEKAQAENIELVGYSKVLTHSDMRTSTKFNRYDLLPLPKAAQSNINVGKLKSKFEETSQYKIYLLKDNVDYVVSKTKEIHKIYERDDYKEENIKEFSIDKDVEEIKIKVAAHGIGANKDGLQKFRTHFFVGDTLHFLIDESNKQIYLLLEKYRGGTKKEFADFAYGVIDRMSGNKPRTVSTSDFFDTYFDRKIENIEGPIWIKVLFFTKNTVEEELFDWEELFVRVSSLSNNVLIISNKKAPNCFPMPANCVFWDFKKVISFQKEYPIEYGVAYPKMVTYKHIDEKDTSKTISKTIIKEKEFDTLSIDHYKALSAVIKEKPNFAIVLGAGVSKDIGAKSWDELIDFFEEKYANDFSHISTIKEKIGKSNIILAQLFKDKDRYYEKESIDSEGFFQVLRNALYKEVEINFSDKSKTLHYISDFVKKNQAKSNLRILTYNYDDFLEQYLDSKSVEHKSLFVKEYKLNENIPIYHVHGFLPNTLRHEESKYLDSIVLTEEDYNSLFNSPYSWEIASQLMFFRESQCLFIGHSITDPNVRRLLEIAHEEGNQHYAVFARDTSGSLQAIDMFWVVYHFKRMGINIIWTDSVTTYSKTIKKILK